MIIHSYNKIAGKVISSSNVAKLLVQEDNIPNGTIQDQEFGKRFEQAYERLCYLWEDMEWNDEWGTDIPKDTKECPECLGSVPSYEEFEIAHPDDDFCDDYFVCEFSIHHKSFICGIL